MAPIGLFYGSQTGTTESIAEQIQAAFGKNLIDVINIADANLSDLDRYRYLIIGCPTWDVGELQVDWHQFLPQLDDMDLSGKMVAFFGPGDQVGYADNFQDAMGILAIKFAERGAKTVGHWPIDGYDFQESKAVVNGHFVGLALDEDNQPRLTRERIEQWVVQLHREFGL